MAFRSAHVNQIFVIGNFKGLPTDIASVTYDVAQGKEFVYATGATPLGYAAGQISTKGTISFLRAGFFSMLSQNNVNFAHELPEFNLSIIDSITKAKIDFISITFENQSGGSNESDTKALVETMNFKALIPQRTSL